MAVNDKLKDHILDSIAEGVFTVDKDFRINFFNKAAEKITGYASDEVVGKFCKHVFKTEMCYLDCPISLVLKSKKNLYDFDSSIHTIDRTKPIKLNAAVLYNEKEDPCGGLITFRDQSEIEILRKYYSETTQFHGIIGHSKSMKEIFSLIKEISDSKAPVFITGESGTGKEMVANAIQKESTRKKEKFILVNCSVFPDNLLASELFGHVKGAFTDAIKDRPGRFELADKGTIFLDEVAEIPPQMQLKLLRVLQEGTFERVGESVTRSTDVRIIAATNIHIENALSEGQFREDLYYRLNVIPIEIPPLRDRIEDVIPLVKHFLEKFSIIYKKEIVEMDDNVYDILTSYHWPGNIRELENVIEYAFVRSSPGERIKIAKLPRHFREQKRERSVSGNGNYEKSINNKDDLLVLLDKNRWNKTETAKELGVGRTTLWRILKKHGVEF
ncbi:MAG: sigma 54-interacting transcriptional regulator [Melioribacteraceae bacterium]|nr:sigma 54-interacting transcriptional regulator [Melioribacteraceae bacterium]MCF8263668.1 sigma 54-interacting transcriptional regulator [Melioribacteraceae bacterium]MCF8431404.1 sigma 54-interacting transcriptional regulator [Melioribacteraceae bacterium]